MLNPLRKTFSTFFQMPLEQETIPSFKSQKEYIISRMEITYFGLISNASVLANMNGESIRDTTEPFPGHNVQFANAILEEFGVK